MKEKSRLHSQVVVEPQSSKLVSFPESGNFYTKTKAEKGLKTLYKMGNTLMFIAKNTNTLKEPLSSTYPAPAGHQDSQYQKQSLRRTINI